MYTTHIESFGGILALSVCVLSVQHITYIRVSGDDLTYHVKEISLLFIQVLYTLQWRVSTREVATEPNANTKATQNKQKKGGKVDKVFFVFFCFTGKKKTKKTCN